MRWERLFADLEASIRESEVDDREALAAELADEDWASRSWMEVLGSHVELELVDDVVVAGGLCGVGESIVRIKSAHHDVVVAQSHVVGVTAVGKPVQLSAVARRLGWRHIFRSARDEGESIEIWRKSARAVTGAVTAVGADFVRVHTTAGAEMLIPYDVIVLVRMPRV